MKFVRFLQNHYSTVKLKVFTADAERVLNLLSSRELFVWKIERSGDELIFWAFEKDLPKIREALAILHADNTVLSVRGVSRAMKELYARRFFAVFAVIAAAILVLCSGFIWSVEIYGARTVEPEALLSLLYEHGFRQSTPRSRLDIHQAELLIRGAYPAIYDVDVELRGARMLVTVFEAASPPAIIDRSIPCDLVAAKDGVVAELYVQNGTAMCKVGDEVKAGDILISGTLNYLFRDIPGTDHVHALGRVVSRETREFGDIPVCMYEEPKDAAAPVETERVVYLFGRTLTFSKRFDKQQKVRFEQKNLSLSVGWLKLPILYDEIKWYNISDCTPKSDASVYDIIRKAIAAQLDGAETISLTYGFSEAEYGAVKVNVTAELFVNIAVEREIILQ